MSTFYVHRDTKPGDSLSYSDLDASMSVYYGNTLKLTTIDCACYGDYDNSCAVERSNYRVLLADKEISPHLVTLRGGHGSTGVAYLGDFDDLPDPLRDAISALDSYPCLDEGDLSELEHEMESEAWESDGSSDFRRALESVFEDIDSDSPTGHDVSLIPDSALYETWRTGCDVFNVNGGSGMTVESGGGVHFYIKEWIDNFNTYFGTEMDPGTTKSLMAEIQIQAIQCREPYPCGHEETIKVECLCHWIVKLAELSVSAA